MTATKGYGHWCERIAPRPGECASGHQCYAAAQYHCGVKFYSAHWGRESWRKIGLCQRHAEKWCIRHGVAMPAAGEAVAS